MGNYHILEWTCNAMLAGERVGSSGEEDWEGRKTEGGMSMFGNGTGLIEHTRN